MTVVEVLAGSILAYFVILNLVYMVLLLVGRVELERYSRRARLRDYAEVAESQLSQAVTIMVPAYNEEPVILTTVRSLLATDYPTLEIVVVNDGSTDGTLDRLVTAYDMGEVRRAPRTTQLDHEPVRAVYRSAREPRLVVIDKVNGGKADALNAALSYARYPLVCAIDSDTVLDPDALSRLVWFFQQDERTVAVGGSVRIANGSKVGIGLPVEGRVAGGPVPWIQIVEYLRGFLGARIGFSRFGMLLIISGAFGLFKRDEVIEVGGYERSAIGEDAELVVRLHRYLREQRRPYRIGFAADPVCWTEAPASLRIVARQRDRWQRGLADLLWRHRRMAFNPRYGRIGLIAYPYYLLFELLGPLLEIFGYGYFIWCLATGQLSPEWAAAFLSLAMLLGLFFSWSALLVETRVFGRYTRWSDLWRLMLAGILENIGYRQWLSMVRVKAFWTMWRNGHQWGEMTREGFQETNGTNEVAAATPDFDADPGLAVEGLRTGVPTHRESDPPSRHAP